MAGVTWILTVLCEFYFIYVCFYFRTPSQNGCGISGSLYNSWVCQWVSGSECRPSRARGIRVSCRCLLCFCSLFCLMMIACLRSSDQWKSGHAPHWGGRVLQADLGPWPRCRPEACWVSWDSPLPVAGRVFLSLLFTEKLQVSQVSDLLLFFLRLCPTTTTTTIIIIRLGYVGRGSVFISLD